MKNTDLNMEPLHTSHQNTPTWAHFSIKNYFPALNKQLTLTIRDTIEIMTTADDKKERQKTQTITSKEGVVGSIDIVAGEKSHVHDMNFT